MKMKSKPDIAIFLARLLLLIWTVMEISLASESEVTTQPPVPEVSEVGLSPPAISPSLPQTIYLLAGSSLDINCTASGRPAPTFSWSRGEELLHSGSQFLVSRVSHNLTGELSCISSNSQGEDKQSSQVFVVNKTSQVGDRLNKIVRNAGESLELGCEVEVDPQIAQSVQRRWFKDGEEVGEEESIGLSYLVADNGGDWRCLVNTAVDSLDIEYSVTVVTRSPRISLLPSQLAGMEGEEGGVRVECSAEGIPTPEVSLRLGDTELSGESEMAGNTTTITASVTLPGTVTCLAVNLYGSHKEEVEVSLFKRTITTEGIGSRIVNSGETVSLHCEVSDGPHNIDVK